MSINKQKFLKMGKEKEKEFCELFKNAIQSTEEQDINEHWDVEINSKIDVKGLKKIRRSDEDVNENIHWLEIKGITGHLGSVYAEHVEYFAFETKKYWIIVDKLELQKLISENVIKEFKEAPTAYYLYQRKDRLDVLTLVPTLDLMYIAEKIIKK
jgi:hypothetical protein